MSTEESSEPACKKMKCRQSMEEKIDGYIEALRASTTNLTPIIDESFNQPVPLTKVFTGIIKNLKDISRTIITLNQKVPMKDLQHLKRVQNKQVIICPTNYLDGKTIQEFIQEKAKELEDAFELFKEIEVPAAAPKVRTQLEVANKVWACNFHPNKYHEKLVSNQFFTEEELKTHKKYVELVLHATKYYVERAEMPEDSVENINCCLVVDPNIKSVVALAFDNRNQHPIQHTVMLAIDNVAKSQNGGAWVASNEDQTRSTNLRGLDQSLCCHLKSICPEINFGAKEFKSKKDMTEKELASSDIGPYLCTGYYVYVLREPCVMCSMALVHARAKRVFFCLPNSKLGGLKSRAKLQTVTSLNHHFEVFTDFW